MARAYIVLLRNDLDDNFLQTLDLVPNTSQRNLVYQPVGQTGYLSHYYIDGVNGDVTTTGVGPITTVGDTYGLAAYLIDRVENSGAAGDPALTDVEANTIAASIGSTILAGNPLTLAAINILINVPAGVSGSDLDGTLGNSTGSVEDILRIVAGERYKLPAGSQVEDVANAFDATVRGAFVTAPNVLKTLSHPGGRKSTSPIPTTAPVQTAPQDVNYVDIREIYDTGDLRRSALGGVLSELKAATYTFLNPEFTYGAGGTAQQLDGSTVVPATGAAAAVIVYDASGNLI